MAIGTLSRIVNPRETGEVRATVEALRALTSSLPHHTLLSSVQEKGLPRRRVEVHQTELRSNRIRSSRLPQSVMSETTTTTAKEAAARMRVAAVAKEANRPNQVAVAAAVTGTSTAAIQEAEIIKVVEVRVLLRTKSDQC